MNNFVVKCDPVKYILDAWIRWTCDNGIRPRIAVDTSHPDLVCGFKHTQGPVMNLSLSVSAMKYLTLDPAGLRLGCTNSGKHYDVYVPYGAIIGYTSPDLLHKTLGTFAVPLVTAEDLAFVDLAGGAVGFKKDLVIEGEPVTPRPETPSKTVGWKPKVVGGTDTNEN